MPINRSGKDATVVHYYEKVFLLYFNYRFIFYVTTACSGKLTFVQFLNSLKLFDPTLTDTLTDILIIANLL